MDESEEMVPFYTIQLFKNQSFRYETNLLGPQLSGKFESRLSGESQLSLQASNLGGTGFTIDKVIALDEPFGPDAFISAGSIMIYEMVVTENPDAESIMRKAHAERQNTAQN